MVVQKTGLLLKKNVRYSEWIGAGLLENALEQIRISVWRLLAHDAPDGFQFDGFTRLTLGPTSYAATAIGVFAALLTINDKTEQPLLFFFPVLPVSPCIEISNI